MPWLQLIVESTPDSAPHLEVILLAAGAAAVTLQDGADQPLYEPPPGATPLWSSTRVVGLFEGDCDMRAVAAGLVAAYGEGAVPPYRIEALEDRDWVRAWMDDFKPMRFGERLWVVPSGFDAPDPQAVNMHLDPGLAFGTGTHPTTALCLEWLDRHPPVDRRVIDYGCGSGILAIAALLLGAARAVGVDNDPQALIASRDNGEKNGVAGRLDVSAPGRHGAAPAPLLLANILAGPLVELAPRLTALVEPGGEIVLSGILDHQAAEVAAAYAGAFEMAPATVRDGWARLSGKKR